MPATLSRPSRPRFSSHAAGNGSAVGAVASTSRRKASRRSQPHRLAQPQPAQLLFDWDGESRRPERQELVLRSEQPAAPPVLGGLLVSVLARYGIDPAPVIEAMQQRERAVQRL